MLQYKTQFANNFMWKNKAQNKIIGNIGENTVVKHLMKHRYKILDRNYLKKWGEIDAIATKNNIIHFFEVKTVDITERKNLLDNYDPEENVHPWKLKRLSRAIQTYILDKDIDDDMEWQVDIAAVFIDFETKKAKIRITEDIGL